ncbi:DNA mismatch repair protein MutS [Tenuifilaceae bacterium CYCD]|nr:DNA mismatch repair protein MutS [Tenuifilaceae bacterium CYCD]
MIKSNKLNADRQTLTELEIFRDDKAGLNIFDLLDKTITSGGRDFLKNHFQNPYNNATDIINMQDALKTITAEPAKFEIPFTKELMDSIEVYYFSKSEVLISGNPIARFLEGLIYRIKYKDFKETALKGSKNTLHFVQEVKRYFDRLEPSNLPKILEDTYLTVNEILNEKDIKMACEIKNVQSLDFIDLITIDQWFRSTHKLKILTLLEIAYTLDAYTSMAKANKQYNMNFPEIVDSENSVLEVENLFHLFIKNPVANSLKYENGKQFMFLTGPNMAGKTTFLKSCGIAIYMAQLGMGVPAKSMKISPFNALFSSLNTTDNLSIGYSYFYSEVMRVRKAAETLQKERKVFMIFDELFKGTNIKDAFDGSMLVINGLLKWKSSLFILASHLTEISKEIDGIAKVFFRYFDSAIEKGKPVFNYKICEGKSNERLGLIILQNENIEELLTPQQ